MLEWLSNNWEKIVTVVLSVLGAVYAAIRQFTGRVERMERDIELLRKEVDEVRKASGELASDISAGLEKLSIRLQEVADIKSWITANDAKMDIILKTIQEDIRELKDDVKQIMRER